MRLDLAGSYGASLMEHEAESMVERSVQDAAPPGGPGSSPRRQDAQ